MSSSCCSSFVDSTEMHLKRMIVLLIAALFMEYQRCQMITDFIDFMV